MRRLFTAFLLFALSLCAMHAQRISHTYHNVSLSDALLQLNSEQSDYAINFLYNELEDFRITTTVKNKRLTDAIQQMIGFYPVRMTVKTDDREVYVECIHKTDRHLTGTIVDEQNQPVGYANVAILNPADSALLSGGVSNDGGYFAIPLPPSPSYSDGTQEAPAAGAAPGMAFLVRISCIGYQTVWRLCDTPAIGTIRLQPETYTIKGVVVKGEIPQYRMTTGGVSVEVQNSILRDVGTADELLSMHPNVQGGDGRFTVFAKGEPEIYINNKKVQNTRDLKLLKSADIKRVDIITSPGAKYNAEVSAVIRIWTIVPQGNGLSVEAFSQVANNEKWTNYDDLTLRYRQGGVELFGSLAFDNDHHSEDNCVTFDAHIGNNQIQLEQYAPNTFWWTDLSGETGASYDFDADNSLGFKYRLERSIYRGGDADCMQTILRNGALEGIVDQWMGMTESNGPVHEANVYYVGKIGKLGIDFNASWLWNKKARTNVEHERSEQLEDRDVHLYNVDHRNMIAGKMVLSYPVWKGELSIGSELTRTHSAGINESEEHYVRSSDDDIQERNHAAFAEYALQLGSWSAGGGLRYEHVATKCLSFGVFQEEPSRRYSDWFPNLSVGWQKGKWGAELSYNKRIRRPAYYAISSYVQYDNRYEVEGGNPLLRPTTRQSLDLRGSCAWLNLTAGYTHSRDIFFSFGSLYDPAGEVVIWNQQNFHRHEAYHASVTASPKVGIWQPTLTLSYWQQHFPAARQSAGVSRNKPNRQVSLRNWFTVGERTKAMVYLHYATSNDYGFTRDDDQFNVDLRLQQTFFNKRLTAIVFAKDIFKTQRDKWEGVYPIATMTKDAYVFTRCFGVSLTYNFNTARSKYRGTGAGNEEKNRL